MGCDDEPAREFEFGCSADGEEEDIDVSVFVSLAFTRFGPSVGYVGFDERITLD